MDERAEASCPGYMAEASSSNSAQLSPLDSSGVPEGFLLALQYVDTCDLLAVEQVCSQLRDAVRQNPLLWRAIVVPRGPSARMTTIAFRHMVDRSQGLLTAVQVDGFVEDGSGLLEALQGCVNLEKLHIPSCRAVNCQHVVELLRHLNHAAARAGKARPKLSQLRVKSTATYRTAESGDRTFILDELQANLCNSQRWDGRHHDYSLQQAELYYHLYNSQTLESDPSFDDPRLLDWDECPRCGNCDESSTVYSCTSPHCEGGDRECRACIRCIERCRGCGRCGGESRLRETLCHCRRLCLPCMEGLPKCVTCDLVCCRSHLPVCAAQIGSSEYFECYICAIGESVRSEYEDF